MPRHDLEASRTVAPFGERLVRVPVAAISFAIVATLVGNAPALATDEWVRVLSSDKRASVLFPSEPQKAETLIRESPAGAVTTQRLSYEDSGVLLTIAETELPRVAIALMSENKILRRAAEGVLENFLGVELSRKRIKIQGEPGLVLRYRVPDYEDPAHPGYAGIAISLLVQDKLYLVNGILTSEDPRALKKQTKLLSSIKIHK